MTSNQIAYMNAIENARHNKAFEGETYRHNIQTETLGKLEYTLAVAGLAETKRSNLVKENIAWGNLVVAQNSQKELARHNLATEQEVSRHNVATEQETSRHNVATENYWNSSLAETIRHNKVSEDYNSSQLFEVSRHNKAMEELNNSNLAESIRHNLAAEYDANRRTSESIKHNRKAEELQNSANDIALANSWTQRLNQQEQARHNKTMEALGLGNTLASFAGNTMNVFGNLAKSIIGGK